MKHLSFRLLWSALIALLGVNSTRAQLTAKLTNAPVAPAGATLTNVLIITNTTTTNLTALMANVNLDPNTTFVAGSVNTSPLAFADAFAALGNVMISNTAPGLLGNDVDPDGVGPALSVIAFQNPSASNGNVVVSANGAFSYNPAPGFEGTDTFTYTISDGEGFSDVGHVSITVSGMIWFVNPAAPAGGDGRLTAPFNAMVGAGSLAAAANEAGDNIFVYSGNLTNGGSFTLKPRQRLIGQGASASLATITGLTPPAGSLPLPATGGARPNVGSGSFANMVLGASNLLRGLNLGSTGAGTTLAGVGFSTLSISEMSVTNTGGRAIDLANGTLSVSLTAVSAAGGTPGIRLANTTDSFAITGNGALAQNGTGGTIQGGANGIELDNVQNVSLARMNFNNTAGNGVWGRHVNGLVIDWCSFANNGDAVDEGGIRLGNIVENGLNGSVAGGAFPTRLANTSLRAPGENNVALFVLTGAVAQLEVTNVLTRDTRTTPLGADGFQIETRNSSIATVNFSSCSFSNNFTQGLQATALGTSALTVNVRNCAFSNNYEGLVFANGNDADLTFDVVSNRFVGNPTNSGAAIAVVNATTVTPLAIYSGKVRNNVINGGGVDNHLVTALFAGRGNNTLLVSSNSIASTNTQFSGIFVQAGETGANGLSAAVTVASNIVSVGTLATDAIFIQSRTNATLCAHITNNTATSAGVGFRGIFVRQRDVSTFRLPGYSGASNSISSVTNFIKANNPATPAVSGTLATGFGGGAACALPLLVESQRDSIHQPSVATPGRYAGWHGTRFHNPEGVESNIGPMERAGCNDSTLSGLLAITSHTQGSSSDSQPWAEGRNPVGIQHWNSRNARAVLLDDAQLQPVVAAAKMRWASAGLSAEQLATLERLKFQVDELGERHAGAASPGLVRLDRNASGFGWFIDPTPEDDVEFVSLGVRRHDAALASPTECLERTHHSPCSESGVAPPQSNDARQNCTASRLTAPTDSVFSTRIDLLSAVLHEMGHQLGLDDSYALEHRDSLMYGFLAPGERRLPTTAPGSHLSLLPSHFTRHVTVPINLATLPPGKSITVVFRSTITNPFPAGVCTVSNQATVTANGGIAVLSDDPRTGAAFDPTVTLVPSAPTISCPANVVFNSTPGLCGRSYSVNPTVFGCPTPGVVCRIGSTVIGAPHVFPIGTNVVTCTATNAYGTNSCSFTVVVRDTELPSVNCPSNIVQTLPPGQSNAVVTYSATASDNCTVTNITYVPPSGSTFPLGTNVVRVSARDSSGNSNGCTFLVILTPPNTPPLRLAGDLAPRVFGPAPVTNSLGFGALGFSPGTNTGEGSQTLLWRARTLPSVGTLLRPGGAVVALGVDYPLSSLLGLRFTPATGAFGFGWFEFELVDNGSPSLSLTQSVAIGVGVTNTSTSVATFGTGFNGPLPAGAALYGTAFITASGGENNGGTLRLTQTDFGQMGSIVIEDVAGSAPVEELDVVFRVRIGGGTSPPADGFSFNWATNIIDGPMGEEGDGDGLRIAFDTFDNGDGEAPAVDVYWRNGIVAHTLVPMAALQTGSDYANVRIRIDASGRLDVSLGANVFYSGFPIPGFSWIVGGRYAIGARTGGLYDNHFIDDLCILPRFHPTRITSFGPPTTMPWVLQFSGTPGYNYVLETSEDLVNWQVRATLLAPQNGLFQFVETNRTTPPARFYRLRGLGAFPPGLRALWHGDGDARDSVGPLHGTPVGVARFAPGVLGEGFDFNATGGAFVFNGAPLPPPWSVGMWVKRRPQIDPSSALLYDAATGLKLEQWPNQNVVGYTQFGVADYSLGFSAPFDSWVHLTFVGTPGDVSLYVNGFYFTTTFAPINLPLAQLGRTDIDRPNATVDEIAVFDRPLNPSDVMQLYRASGGN